MSDRLIDFASGVNLKGKPFVHIAWGSMKAQLTPEEAIKHALGVIEVAQGAVMDAFLLNWFQTVMKVPIRDAAVLLKDLRAFREARVSQRIPEGMDLDEVKRELEEKP